MRGLHVFLLVAVGLAAACATSTPVHETTGQGGASTGAGWLVGTTGSGTRACGVNSSDMACTSCINARCCDEGKACGEDPNCLSCVSKVEAPSLCQSNQELATFNLCLQNSCSEACLGGASTTSSGVGGAPTTTSSTASSSVASSSSTATSSSSATSSSVASSSSTAASSSAASSSSSSSGGAPTCASVDANVGCCDAAGLLYYCSDGQTVTQQTCTGGDVCGWTAVFGYYDCVPPPGGVDPGGTYPLACGG